MESSVLTGVVTATYATQAQVSQNHSTLTNSVALLSSAVETLNASVASLAASLQALQNQVAALTSP